MSLYGLGLMVLNIGILLFRLEPRADYPVQSTFLIMFWAFGFAGIFALLIEAKGRTVDILSIVGTAAAMVLLAVWIQVPKGADPFAFWLFMSWSLAAAFAMMRALVFSGFYDKQGAKAAPAH